MRNRFTILFLLFFNCTCAWSQFKTLKTTTPCDIELLKKTPGRWMPVSRSLNAKISKQQEQEIVNRLNIIHQWTYNIYRSPMAFDAAPMFHTEDQAFASQLKIERTQYGFRSSPVGGTATILYEYVAQFCNYYCVIGNYEILKGAGCEGGTNIFVTANSLDPLFLPLNLDDFYAEIMRIDDRPIKMMRVVKEQKWKGYDVYSGESGSNIVLLRREGILPYMPVTRKQYLDRSIECIQRSFEKVISEFEKPEGLTLLMDKKEKDEQLKKQQKLRDDLLKYYRDELDATTKNGLLKAPAIIFGDVADVDISNPIFITQAKGGKMLVTENPFYFKKDLPKYIPQLMVYIMVYAEDLLGPSMSPYRLYEQDFPILSLQAMIDK